MNDDLAAIYKDNLDAMMSAARALMNGCQALNVVTLAFLQTRLKDSLGTTQRLAECSAIEEAFEIQMEHLKTTLQATVDQGRKVAELTSGLISSQPVPARKTPAATTTSPLAEAA